MVEEGSRTWSGKHARELIRAGKYDGPTSGIAANFVQVGDHIFCAQKILVGFSLVS